MGLFDRFKSKKISKEGSQTIRSEEDILKSKYSTQTPKDLFKKISEYEKSLKILRETVVSNSEEADEIGQDIQDHVMIIGEIKSYLTLIGEDFREPDNDSLSSSNMF